MLPPRWFIDGMFDFFQKTNSWNLKAEVSALPGLPPFVFRSKAVSYLYCNGHAHFNDVR